MKYSFAFIIMFIMVCIAPLSAAMACKCMRPTPDYAKKAYEEAPVVASFGVKDIQASKETQLGRPSYVTIIPVQIYKGLDSELDKNTQSLKVMYNASTAACGHVFNAGETYMLALQPVHVKAEKVRYEVMNSCTQHAIRFHIENQDKINQER